MCEIVSVARRRGKVVRRLRDQSSRHCRHRQAQLEPLETGTVCRRCPVRLRTQVFTADIGTSPAL